MDNLDFLDGQTPEPADTPAVQAEPTPETAPGAQQGPLRGPDGKFAPKDAAAPQGASAPAPEQAPHQAAPAAAPEGYVPLAAFMQLRDEMRDIKRQVAPPPPQYEPVAPPDPYEDPEGFAAYNSAQVQQATYGVNLQWSRRIAEIQHGPEVTGQAFDWGVARCDADPFFNQKVASSQDPVGFVVAEWKREQLLSKVADPADIDAFLAWKAGQAPAAPLAAAPAAFQQSPTPPPRSLAAAPNAGGTKPGEQPVGPGVAFGSVFGN